MLLKHNVNWPLDQTMKSIYRLFNHIVTLRVNYYTVKSCSTLVLHKHNTYIVIDLLIVISNSL